jgi:hypothetical protein
MRPLEGIDEERRLDEALAALRREESQVETPARVEAALIAAWLVEAAFRRPDMTDVPIWRRTSQYGALAAGLVLTIALGHLGGELRNAAVTVADAEGQRLLLVGEPILAGEVVRVVRMQVPAATLARLGMRSTAGETADAVAVDVVIGEDGVARAIRFQQ